MKVCVVIPVYNGKGVVDKLIHALIRQTHKPDKIVCVDDASIDNSGDYIRKKFPFVKVIKNKINLGAPGAYAKGIRYAYKKGYNYIWLLDQDDIPFKDALKNLLNFKKSSSNILVSTLIEPSTHIIYPMLSVKNSNIDLNRPYEAEVVNFAGMLLPRDLIKKAGYPLKELVMDASDWEYCLRCKNLGYKIFVIPKSKVYHIEGKPTKVKLPPLFKRVNYKLKRGIIQKFHTNYWLTRFDSSKRYYTRIKNTILVMKLPYATTSFKLFALKLLFKQLFKIVFYEEKKDEKIIAFFHGLIDGLSGNIVPSISLTKL